MALKGKKKSRSRGSQARRRPAAAPRPAYGSIGKARWYQTTAGLVLAFLAVATVGILVWWYVADNRAEAQELETAQTQLATYTESLKQVVDSVTPTATDLAAAGDLKDDELVDQTREWTKQLAAAQAQIAQTTPAEGLEPLNGLVTQAVLLYIQSAEQYALLPSLEGDTRDNVAGKAAASFQAASGIFAGAIELLDTERQDNEMNASGLTAPGTPAGAMAPSEQIQIPPPGGDAEEGDG